ncbi:MAG: dialkylrecorsinol condensing enzyme DarA [Crocinitomicaceae bacterium]|nr:dialkylrecorsinol condensing enzyme DarA [Crocinitomicaceae bacterium]
MKKQILIVYYTQTGQLLKILEKIAGPFLADSSYEIEYLKLEMEKPFPFPWNRKEFFGIMPDSVQEKPHTLKPFETKHDQYDLIILGYQVWFLSPSVPFTSFLDSPKASSLLNNSNVLTVIGGRNMWVMAHESIKKKLQALNAKLVGNIALVDKSPNLVSVVTIIYWLFHGKTDRLLNLFPKPGIKNKDIEDGKRYGEEIKTCLESNNLPILQRNLVSKGAVALKFEIISMETKAKKVFKVWAKIINWSGIEGSLGRKVTLFLFEIYLYFVILFLSPLISILSTFAAILRRKATAKKLAYYSGV